MNAQLENAANTITALTPNPGLQEVIKEYLRFKYINHVKMYGKRGFFRSVSYGVGCGCELCKSIDEVTQWTKVVIRYEYSGWRGGWKSASPAYVEAIKGRRRAVQKRDELKSKLSTYA